MAPGKRINDLPDHTVQGIWEAHQADELAVEDELDDMIIRAAGVLAEKGHWTWMFQAASEDASSWKDRHGIFWVMDPKDGEIWELSFADTARPWWVRCREIRRLKGAAIAMPRSLLVGVVIVPVLLVLQVLVG